MSANTTVTTRRDSREPRSGAAVSAVPHSRQNLARSGFSVPQTGQRTSMSADHPISVYAPKRGIWRQDPASAIAARRPLLLRPRVAGLLLGRRHLAHRQAALVDLLLHRLELLALLDLFALTGRLGRHGSAFY